jgi:AraC family transcriptional regulator of adaptative response / DNA-3-methyladenine glycosylase II
MAENQGDIVLSPGFRPPYAWDELIGFLGKRAIPGVENVADGVYRRTVSVSGEGFFRRGWVSVANRPESCSLSVAVSSSLEPVLPQIISRIECLFDLDCDPSEVYEKLGVMNELSPGMCLPGIRVPGCFDPFEISVRAILGQQVTVKAARTLAMRLAAAFGEKIEPPFAELNVTFPGPERICEIEPPVENRLGPLGITGARARSIRALAEAMVTGAVSFSSGADPLAEMEKLRKIPGFGPWTVQYVGMRAFGWPDAFPHTDLGVRKTLPGLKPREILNMSQAWKPWRSYASLNLWNSLKEKDQAD